MEMDASAVSRISKLYPSKQVLCETPGSIVFTAERKDEVKGTATVVVKKVGPSTHYNTACTHQCMYRAFFS